MDEMQTTTIDLLRHGACAGGEIFRGSTDVALTELGWQQMQAALAQQGGWQQIVSSPLQRCRLFAEQLATAQHCALSVCDDLREIHFGDWEGCLHTDVERDHGPLLRQFWSDPSLVCPPNGEPMALFGERVRRALVDIVAVHRGKHLLLITHGAVIRLLLCEWLQMRMTAFSNIAVPYAALTRVQIFERPGYEPWIQLRFHRGD